MSHPLYNPYASGNQSSSQGQYGRSDAERDPRRASSLHGPGSSLSSSRSSSAVSNNSGRMIPPLMPQLRNYRSEQSRTATDAGISSPVNVHMNKAREEVRHVERSGHRSLDQDAHFSSTFREEFGSSDTRLGSQPMSSTYLGQRHNLNVQGGSSSLDWSSKYNRPTASDSKPYFRSSSSSYASCYEVRFNPSVEGHRDMQSIPGLVDYDCPSSHQPAASAETIQPKYSPETAADILLHFGLEKEDLKQLISYSEDQITPANLPFILRQIRLQKSKRAATGVQSNPNPAPRFGGAEMQQEKTSTGVFQSSRVIDYGHTGKYIGSGAGDETGRKSNEDVGRIGSTLVIDDTVSRHNPVLGSSQKQAGTFTSLSSSCSSALSSAPSASHNQTKQLLTRPNPTFQSILGSLSQTTKNANIRGFEFELEHQSTLKIQPPPPQPSGMNPTHSGPVLSDHKERSKTKGKGSVVVEHVTRQLGKPKEQLQQAQTQQTQGQHLQQKEENQTTQKQDTQEKQKQQPEMVWPPAAPVSNLPLVLGNPHRSMTPPQPTVGSVTYNHLSMSNVNPQPAAKSTSFKTPPKAMINDYAAAPPKQFPFSCSLCHRFCINMQDWISHQNSFNHFQGCKELRKKYPEWADEFDGKTRYEGHTWSKSPSPHCDHGSDGERERRRSRSRSPCCSRHHRRSGSPSLSRSRSRSPKHSRISSRCRSRSRSRERRSSTRRRDRRGSTPRSSRERRSPPRRKPERASSTEESSPERERRGKAGSAEKLAKKLLETSGVQSLPDQFDLETVVKTLAPALVAELAKIKSSSFYSDKGTKPSSSQSSAEGKRSSPTTSSSSSAAAMTDSVTSPSKEKSGSEKTKAAGEEEEAEKPGSSRNHDEKGTEVTKVMNDCILTPKPKELELGISFQSQEAVPAVSDKPNKSQTSSVETSVKASTSIQQSTPLGPASKAPEPPTGTKGSYVAAERVGSMTQIQQTAPAPMFTPRTCGEKINSFFNPLSMGYVKLEHFLRNDKTNWRTLIISNLPQYKNGCYTEENIAELFSRFGFCKTDDNMFVFPYARFALIQLPGRDSVLRAIKAVQREFFTLKGSPLDVTISLEKDITPFRVYQRIMKKMKRPFLLQNVCLVKNIPLKEVRDLRWALKDFGHFANFMPLLNKVFIEFLVYYDAKRFGHWYDSLKPGRGREVHLLSGYKYETPETYNAGSTRMVYSADGPHLILKLTLEDGLCSNKICILPEHTVLSPQFLRSEKKLLLISGLPAFKDGAYTEADVVNLLIPFGFLFHHDKIYVVPQTCTAFVLMETTQEVQQLVRACQVNPLTLKGSELTVNVVTSDIKMPPINFYTSLMKLMCGREYEKQVGERLIFIRNASPREIRELTDTFKATPVQNTLPLLDKVFIQFDSPREADWFGVWHSLQSPVPGYIVHRLKIPVGNNTAPSPKFPKRVPRGCMRDIGGVTVTSLLTKVPEGASPPFWITLRNSPFVFPSLSPCFVIPPHHNIKNMADIQAVRHYKPSTIMLTGLPQGKYKHEDVARLVWPYFREQDRSLHSLYYKVTVLPLQRRAFVFFPDWNTCSYFIQEQVSKPLFMGDHLIRVQCMLKPMHPESSEELLYKSLMNLSSAGVPDPDPPVKGRLLCVEVSEVSVQIISTVVDTVASVAPIVNFLPLANRICIEMAEPAGVTKVLETFKIPLLDPDTIGKMKKFSNKVLGFESMTSLRQRLQDSGEASEKFQRFNASVEIKLPPSASQTSDPPAELPSTLETGDRTGWCVFEPSAFAIQEDVQSAVTGMVMDSVVGSSCDENVVKMDVEEKPPTSLVCTVEAASEVESENQVPTSSVPDPPSSEVTPEEEPEGLPQIDTDTLQALAAEVHQHRDAMESRSPNISPNTPDLSSVEISSHQKAQQSSSKSPAGSSDPESSCRTRSSSAAEEVDQVKPVEASAETPPEELMKDARDGESSGAQSAKSDDKEEEISGADQTHGDRDNSSENQQTGPAGTQTLHEESMQTLGSADNQPNPLKMEGEVLEVEEEEEKDVVEPKRRGRAKRTRWTLRKSTRRKTHEPPSSSREASSSLDKDPSKVEVQKTAEEGAKGQSNVEEEDRRRTEIKALIEQRREFDGPRAKRSRSQSPSVPADHRLPSFKPNNPLGQEFVVPKMAYFCNLCSVFYHNESTAKETHCSSQKHYDNLKKYYKKLQHTSARSSLESSQGSVSD